MKISGGLRVWSRFPAAVLRITGEDASSFLQGQFSNDLRGLAVGEARYGLWLTVKGKVLADSYIVKPTGPGILAVSLGAPADLIRRRLEDFVIADDVVVDDETPRWAVDTLVGEGAAAWIPSGSEGGALMPYPGRHDRIDWLRLRTGPSAELAALPALSREAFEALRIGAGMPEIPKDVGPGDLPHEGGLESVAVSYDKGCYLGQEIMARLKTRGRVRRHLAVVRGPGPVPAVPSVLSLLGKPAGELRSAAALESGYVGLAMLPADLSPEQRLSVGAGTADLSIARD